MEESWEYIAQARMQSLEDKYNKAFEMYLTAFKRNPNLRAPHEVEFRSVLLRLNTMLAESNRMDVIFDNFGLALTIYPGNPRLLNDIGKYLYKFSYLKEAMEHFEKVLILEPTFAECEKNLNSIKNLLVERWHFRMLNDNLRNESYRQGIRDNILTLGEKVLDVGTGTGLLAIYAHEASASKVVGCDGSELMSNLADNIIRKNRIKTIKIINKMSQDLTLWDLGGKCSVLVTELFDAGLFGEHILQTLSHARQNLLINEAVVVPNSAEFFVMGVECDLLNKNYQLSSEAKALLNISSLNVHADCLGETYDCDDVHFFKGIKYLTEAQSLLKVNFNDLEDITHNLERTEPYRAELKTIEDGQINVIIGWFKLYLSELVTITTDPRAPDRANAWQQAIFFDEIPKRVKLNDLVNVEFLMNGGKLTMLPCSKTTITRVDDEIIRFLNDSEYMTMITNCVRIGSVYLSQMVTMSDVTVADLCPFPLFGLMMLKRGAKSLLCCATNECNKEFITKVFSENGVPMSKVTFILGDDWSQEDISADYKFHAIFTHMLEFCGDISVRLRWIAEHLKNSHLERGGLFMPAQVSIVTQLISSHWLDLNNRLYDDNVSKYTMAAQVNRYRVTQNFNIDFSTLKYVPITDPIVLCNYPNGLSHEEKLAQVVVDGYANAILCWYNIELIQGSQIISTNRPMSFMAGMLFLTYPKEQMSAGKFAKIIQHKDTDGCFKVTAEPEIPTLDNQQLNADLPYYEIL